MGKRSNNLSRLTYSQRVLLAKDFEIDICYRTLAKLINVYMIDDMESGEARSYQTTKILKRLLAEQVAEVKGV